MKGMKKKSINWASIAFIGPHMFLFIIFVCIPTVYGIYASFTQWNLISDPVWVGLNNYKTLLFDSSSTFYTQFWNGLKNTFIFVLIMVPLQIIIPLMIAAALQHKKVKLKGLFQAVLYIPGLISVSAGSLIWSLIFHSRLGAVNNIFGFDFSWASRQPYAWILIFAVSIWGAIGGNMIIYRSALAGVNEDLYEAAEIDGAGSFQKFLNVTLPSIRFPLLYTIVMTTAGAFNVFAQPLMMTGGGPNQSTTVLMMYIRSLAFSQGESIAGMASAMAVILGLIIMCVSVFQYFLLDRSNT
ncbi:sugar ABC transporter permease [Enterococcus faecium]|uniref:carbohydrate ABC transporter permease n=1 Tax=Enterococcus faecium TaxID=1352 RepID=UPI002892170E|nr:sugar ABC transporter permease [Enterococcus faecium]MDT2326952.1 sugar ABC transporter permease [Enterococcus faecium]